MIVRLLTLGDEPVLDAFLAAHRDSAMIPRSNIRRVGVVYQGQAFGGQYVGERRAAGMINWQIDEGLAWVALEKWPPGFVLGLQLGSAGYRAIGRYLHAPRTSRSRSCRAAIAAQLLASRAAGVERAVLFASDAHAMRCYEGLGFRRIDDFWLVLW